MSDRQGRLFFATLDGDRDSSSVKISARKVMHRYGSYGST
jgi:hypothetical protein